MRAPSICFLLALVTLAPAAPAAADPDCIDYASYLHLTGSALSHDRALKVAVAEPYAYVADGFAGLLVFDVSLPAFPHVVTVIPTPDFAQGVAVEGNLVVVAAGSAGVLIFDRTDPEVPVLAASVPSTVSLQRWV